MTSIDYIKLVIASIDIAISDAEKVQKENIRTNNYCGMAKTESYLSGLNMAREMANIVMKQATGRDFDKS